MIAYGYVRVSTAAQEDSGLGEDAQRRYIAQHYEQYLKPQGFAWGGVFPDLAVSAGKHDFAQRPQAALLNLKMQPGDAIIFYRIDRAFRNVRDMLNNLHAWDKKQVKVCSCDLGGMPYDSQSPTGKVVAFVFGLAAELEYDRNCSRGKDRVRSAKLAGRPTSMASLGFRIIKNYQKQRILHPDDKERAIMALMEKWVGYGHSYRKIAAHLIESKCWNRRSPYGRWNAMSVLKMLRAWEQIKQLDMNLKPGEYCTVEGVVMKRAYPVREDLDLSDSSPEKWDEEYPQNPS